MKYLRLALVISVFLAVTIPTVRVHAIMVPPPPLSVTACGTATPLNPTEKQQNACVTVGFELMSGQFQEFLQVIRGTMTIGADTFHFVNGTGIYNLSNGLVETIWSEPSDCKRAIMQGFTDTILTGPGSTGITFLAPESKLVGFADHAGETFFLSLTGTLTIS